MRSRKRGTLQPLCDFNQERLQREWWCWNEIYRQVYIEWLDWARPKETSPLEAANFAAHKTRATMALRVGFILTGGFDGR